MKQDSEHQLSSQTAAVHLLLLAFWKKVTTRLCKNDTLQTPQNFLVDYYPICTLTLSLHISNYAIPGFTVEGAQERKFASEVSRTMI